MAKAPASKARSGAKSGKASGKASPNRSGGKAQKQTASKAAAASKSRSPTKAREASKKRTPSKSKARQQPAKSQNWGSAISSLVTSSLGREILADVLEAAAAALKRERPGLQAAGAEQIARAGEAATNIGTEIASGTAALAQTAVGVLAEVVSDTARSVLPGGTSRNER